MLDLRIWTNDDSTRLSPAAMAAMRPCRTRRATLALWGSALLLAVLALAPPRATAGTYVVSACGAAPGGVNHSWSPYASHPNVTAYGTPCAPISGGLIARAAANGQSAPQNAVAGWTFTRPSAETLITGVEISAEIYRLGGDAYNFWGVGLFDDTGNYLWGGGATTYLHAGTASGSYLPVAVNNRTSISLGIWCANAGGCTTASGGDPAQDYSRARTALFGARVTLSNASNPGNGNFRGRLWTDTGWVNGTQDVGYDSGDDIGVKRLSVAIDGDEHGSDSSCDYTWTVPCPGSRGFDTTFSTAGFPDGGHALIFRSTDASGNVRTDAKQIFIDNNAPAAPSTPQLAGVPSSTWRTVNGFTLTYANPSTGNGSESTSSDVQLCSVDEQGTPQLAACTVIPYGTAGGSNTFSVPAPGKYKARVRVNDRLYTGAWSDWGPVLRFDNVVPGKASQQVYNGWLTKADIAAGMKVEPRTDQPKPSSGFAGYAIARDGSLPGTTPTVSSASDGRAVVDLRSWIDGTYEVRTRSISVAGLSSTDDHVVTSVVNIDTTAPSVGVTGAPTTGTTVNKLVVLDIAATDTLSGMTPAGSTDDVTEGAYLVASFDGQPETRHRGASLRLAVADGRHTFRFSAVDVAGNRSADTTVTFTQDTSAPQGGLLPLDPNDQRHLAFFVSEECIANAVIELTTDGGATWRPLDTMIDGQSVAARIPDDVWDERTAYSVRAQVSDCAGNHATLDQWYGGVADGKSIGTVTLPQRVAVNLTAAFTRLELSQACVKVSRPRVVRSERTGRTRVVRRTVKVCPRVAAYGAAKKVMSRTREVFGVLTDTSGRALAGRAIHVQVQPKVIGADWQTVRVVQTDAHGLIRAVVRKFTSLHIRLVAPRDESFAHGVSQTLTTNVAARSTISVDRRHLRNGDVVRLAGRIQGGHVPSAGMQIALYGYSPSKRRWLPVRTTVRVDPRGNWAAVYRFTATKIRATYRFRVRIAERAMFPFSIGYSRALRVTVRP